MLHRSKKVKFSYGQDSNQALMKKLIYNFFMNGKMDTTVSKAKVLKSFIERTVEKTKTVNEANKNYLLKYFADKKVVDRLFAELGPSFKEIQGGYVRIVKLNQRASDGALMARITWAHPLAKTAAQSASPVVEETKKAAPVETQKEEVAAEVEAPKKTTRRKAVKK